MFHIWWHRQGPGDGDYLGIDRSLGGGLLVSTERFIPTLITGAMGIVTGKSTFRADQRTLLCSGGSHGRNLRYDLPNHSRFELTAGLPGSPASPHGSSIQSRCWLPCAERSHHCWRVGTDALAAAFLSGTLKPTFFAVPNRWGNSISPPVAPDLATKAPVGSVALEDQQFKLFL